MELDLSIILVSHGHEALLPAALAGIARCTQGLSVEAILVDNLNHPDFDKSVGPQPFEMRILSNPTPRGLSSNTNQAASVARGRFILMLNPDTEHQQGQLIEAINYLRDHPTTGVLGCRLLYPDGRHQQTYRRFPMGPAIFIRGLYASRWPWQPQFYRRNLMQGVSLDSPTAVDWMLGAWLLMRRDDFFQLAGLDENFFLYYEDIDLCYRVRQRGQSCIYFPAVTFYHRYDRSSAKAPLGKAWQMHVSSICRYFWKHRYFFRSRLPELTSGDTASGAAA